MLRCRNGFAVPRRRFATSAAAAEAARGGAYLRLRESVRAGDVEGYFCGSLMPSASRDSFFTMRALNVELAGVRDAARGNAATARLRFGFWRALVGDAFAAGAGGGAALLRSSDHPLFAPLAASVARHRHTRRWLERLIDAREADAEGRPPSTVADLEAYAEATYGSLLYLSLEAVGVRDVHADHAASHIGKALGLAMALRALPVHARLGQRYLPDELLKKVRARAVIPPPPLLLLLHTTPLTPSRPHAAATTPRGAAWPRGARRARRARRGVFRGREAAFGERGGRQRGQRGRPPAPCRAAARPAAGHGRWGRAPRKVPRAGGA